MVAVVCVREMRPPFAILVLLLATVRGSSGTKLARQRRRNQDVPATTPQPTCLYYTNYVSGCTNDCGQAPTQATYETLGECCINHHNYEGPGGYDECMNTTAEPTAAPTSNAPTGKQQNGCFRARFLLHAFHVLNSIRRSPSHHCAHGSVPALQQLGRDLLKRLPGTTRAPLVRLTRRVLPV